MHARADVKCPDGLHPLASLVRRISARQTPGRLTRVMRPCSPPRRPCRAVAVDIACADPDGAGRPTARHPRQPCLPRAGRLIRRLEKENEILVPGGGGMVRARPRPKHDHLLLWRSRRREPRASSSRRIRGRTTVLAPLARARLGGFQNARPARPALPAERRVAASGVSRCPLPRTARYAPSSGGTLSYWALRREVVFRH